MTKQKHSDGSRHTGGSQRRCRDHPEEREEAVIPIAHDPRFRRSLTNINKIRERITNLDGRP